MISLQNITYTIAARTLLEQTSLTLPAKKRFGLVGRNGSGKTTLFKMLTGELSPTDGKVEGAQSLKVISLAQETPSGEHTPLDMLLQQDQKRVALMKELEEEKDPLRLGDLYEELLAIDAFTAEARAAKILKGLGFDEADQNRPLHTFSGGFRKRVTLAMALFQDADLLLLDEPTNHLDFESVVWLRKFLKTYPQTFVLISHDRSLLNEVTEATIHLHSKKLTLFKGNYDRFEETFALQKMTRDAYNKKVTAQRAHLQKFVDRFRAKASKAKQAQSRMKALEKLSTILPPEDDPNIHFKFPEAHPLPSPFLSFDHLDLGYDDYVVLKKLQGSIGQEDRLALLGKNGNGKSTFAKFLAGALSPMDGKERRLSKLRVGHFRQHQLESLDPAKTALDNLMMTTDNTNTTALRSHLGNFGLAEKKALTPVGKLSGGEKARLAFAIICLVPPHLLVMDEPTNHLDMEMRDSLVRALSAFSGAVVVISHDWHFLESVVNDLWIVKDQSVTPFSGTLEDYQRNYSRL